MWLTQLSLLMCDTFQIRGRLWQSSRYRTKCNTCPDGYTTQLDNNKLTSSAATKCKACPLGWIDGDKTADTHCAKCGSTRGKYMDQTAQTKCKACPDGWWQNEAAKTECKQCPTGPVKPFAECTWYLLNFK